MSSKKFIFLFMYKVKWSKIVRNTDEIWASIKDVRNGMGVKNISDLVLKELCSVLKIKNLTKEQISEYKIRERELY